jgi:hypothetical protein
MRKPCRWPSTVPFERLRAGRETQGHRRAQVERELSLTESRLARLANALAEADDAPMPTLVARLKAEEERKLGLARQLETFAQAESRASLDADQVRETVRERAANLRSVLERSGPQVRAALVRILVGNAEPVVVDGCHGYRVTGRINVAGLLPDAMFAQFQAISPFVVAPTGHDPTCRIQVRD